MEKKNKKVLKNKSGYAIMQGDYGIAMPIGSANAMMREIAGNAWSLPRSMSGVG